MAASVLAVVCVILAGSCFLRISGQRLASGWLLSLCPFIICSAILMDLSRGVRQLGQAAVEDDRRRLAFCLGLLVISLMTALRPNWVGLFWLVWTLQAIVVAIFLYIMLVWKVFQ